MARNLFVYICWLILCENKGVSAGGGMKLVMMSRHLEQSEKRSVFRVIVIRPVPFSV